MNRPSNIQQVQVQPPLQPNNSQIKFIKRSTSQAEAAQQNIDNYYKRPHQSLEHIQEAPPRKTLSRKNSGISPLFKNQLRAKDSALDPPKKFNTVQEIAMHMAAHIFMLATTKFVPGFDDLSSMSGEAKSYRKGPASPPKSSSKAKEGHSVPPSRENRVETKKTAVTPSKVIESTVKPAVMPPNRQNKAEPRSSGISPNKAVENIAKPAAMVPSWQKNIEPRKTVVTPTKEVESNVKPSMISGSNVQSPKFFGMSDVRGKSKLQQSFDEIASQNASKLNRSQVRIREIQPDEIVHVTSGIRTKVKQNSSSLVKSETPKNPESSIHRIAERVIVNAANYGQQPVHTPRQEPSHSPSPPPKERAISQPAQRVNSYKLQPQPQKQPLAPKQPEENKEQPSIIKMGGVTPKPQTTPQKSTTPIKSTIGLQLQSKTDLPKPFNPYGQKNTNNQLTPASQPTPNNPIRNRFQTEMINQATSQPRAPVKPAEVKPAPKQEKNEETYPIAARYGRQQTKEPEKSIPIEPKNEPIVRKYPYNDTVIRQVSQKPTPAQESSGPSMTASRMAKSVEASAYHMASETYFNSTTKYNRSVGTSSKKLQPSPKKESPPKKIEKPSPAVQAPPTQTNANQSKAQALRPSLNSSRPVDSSRPVNTSQPKKQEVSPPKPKPANEPVKPSSRTQSQSKPENVPKVAEPTAVPTPPAQPVQTRVNRFQTDPAKKEEDRSISRNQVQAFERKPSNNSKRQIKFGEKKEEETTQPVSQTQYRASLSKTQPVTVNPAKAEEKEESTPKMAPFSRQPAGGQNSRSPLLFTNKDQEKPANKDIKASTSPAFTRNKAKPQYTSPAVKQEVGTQKMIRNAPSPNTTSTPSIPVNNRVQSPLTVQTVPSQQTKEAQPKTPPVQRYGKGLQSKPTQDTSFQSVKNTTNTLAASKSSEAIEKVWKPVQPIRPTNNIKSDASNSTHQEPSKKVEPKGPQKNTQPPNQPKTTHQPPQSDSSIKAQPQKAVSKQNLTKNTEPTSLKLIPPGDISDKKSPSNKNLPYTQPSSKNVTVKTTVTQSPQNSTIQNQTKPTTTHNYQPHTQANKPARTVTQTTSPQPVSAKNITGSTTLSRETPQIKSQSHIRMSTTRDVKVDSTQAKVTEAKEENSNLQRSLAVVYSVSKLRAKTKKSSFTLIKEKGIQQVKHMKQATILTHSVHALVSSLLRNIYNHAFDQLKKSFISSFKASKDTSLKSEQIKQQAANLVACLLVSKVRDHWKSITNSNWINKQIGITHSPKEINLQYKGAEVQTEIKKRLLSSYLVISKSAHSAQLRKGFDKILQEALRGTAKNKLKGPSTQTQPKHQILQAKSPQKPSKDYEADKRRLLDTKFTLENELANVEYRLSDLKKGHEREKGKLIKKMEDLRKKNNKFEGEVNAKRKKNKQLKDSIEKCPSSENILPEGEPLLDLLTQIYVEVYRSTQQVIDPSALIKKHSLNKEEDYNSIIEEWNALSKQLKLRSQIALWEGTTKAEGKANRALREQKEVSVTLLKTYTRERYLWEWVHTASARI